MTDGAASFEECSEHRAWVRALAARLCAGAGDAEQDAWIEVARGRATPRSPRRWLGGVLRHLARRERRRASARTERERFAARTEAVPSADDLLAQAELQRRVLAAVAELDEAQRVVVLMHYYEGCDGGERAAWSALLAPAMAIESGSRAATIGVGVAMKIQVAVVAATAITVAVLLWPEHPAERGVADPAAVELDASAQPRSSVAANASTKSAVPSRRA